MFDLPDPGAYRLQRPPLAIALVQVHYPLLGRLQDLSGITPVQERLRPLLPYMQQIQAGRVQMGLGSQGQLESIQAATGAAWRFTDDSGWTAVVEPGTASLSVGPTYGSIAELEARLELLLGALAEVPGMVRCDRLGVRYVNVAGIPPGKEANWPRWFRRELFGFAALDIFAEQTQLTSTILQTVVNARPTGPLADIPHNVQGIVHNGIVPAGTVIPVADVPALQTPAVLLDIDLSVAGPQTFVPPDLLSQFRLLHSQIDAFFYWSLTEDGKTHFGLIQND